MGTWGSGLYANDDTSDVRNTYIKCLEEGLSNAEAYEKTLESLHDYIGSDEEPLFWYALAETQWRVGRLTPEVKKKALEWIGKNGGLEQWEDSANKGAGWIKTLGKLKQKLESPMPPEKKIKKPEELDLNLWNLNDVYAYQFHGKNAVEHGYFGKYMLLQKIGADALYYGNKPMMRVQIMDKVFDHLPSLDDLDGLRILPVDNPIRVNISQDALIEKRIVYKKNPIWMSASMVIFKKSEYPKKHLTYIGNKEGPPNTRINDRELDWGGIDKWLYEFYERWQGIEFDTVGHGEYEYTQNPSNR